MTVVTALIGAVLVVTAAVPATADGGLQLSADASPSVLAGNVAKVTLTATNDSGSDEYNTSFRYVLPVGVTYTGTTSPSSAGEPQIVTGTDGAQTLIWSNVADLLAADSTSIAFSVTADDTKYPVGASFSAQAGVYTSADARTLPKFTAAGAPVPDTTTPVYSATATSTTTNVSALLLTKSAPSNAPETELMRGVHDNPTVYTLTVSNTKEAATDSVVVDDYLPAGLEFLQCGGIDNTSAGTVEYPGANRLTQTTADTGGNCLTPTSVTTVANPTGYPTGVYTHVQWTIGTLAALGTKTIEYVAAIPMRENTATFAGGTPAATGAQAANLDNNTGPSTRQDGAATTWTNTAVASGQYTGPVANAADRTTTSTDSSTVKASDLSIVKSVASNTFVAGQMNTYSLLVRSSEYASDHGMTITDTIGDGLCPVVPATATRTGDAIPADCDTAAMHRDATGGTITAVDYTASTGVFVITIKPGTDPLAAESSETISYGVLMRNTYADGSPTAAGDSFTNKVGITGTSTSVPGLGVETGDKTVTDDSGTTITTGTTQIDKEILPRTNVASAADCRAAGPAAYQETTPTGAFQLGDNVCFLLSVTFPGSTDTRNARITDMVPTGTTYAGYSYATGSTSTVPAADVQTPTVANPATEATWAIGHTVSGNTGTYVDKGDTLQLYVMATITGQGSNAAKPDLVDNLMKYRQTDSSGKAISLRDSVGYDVASSPTVTLGKSIVSRNGSAITPTTSTSTAEGQTLGYQLTVSNTGTSTVGNDQPVSNTVVWDRLPAGITCAAVTTPIPNAGTCSDTAPTGASDTTRSYITWTITTAIAAGSSTTLPYSITVPNGVSVSQALTNDSSVTRFTTTNTAGGTTTWRPTGSLDTRTPAGTDGTAPAANAAATATLPDASVQKTGGAVVTTATNVSGATGVQGQGAAYDYVATVPANSSVFNATLADPDLTSGSLPIDASGAVYTVTMPDGTTYNAGDTITYGSQTFTLAGGTLTFPTTFDNTTSAAVQFTVHVTGLKITPTAPLAAFTNTARFSSTTTAAGGTTLPDRTGTDTVTVTAPSPAIVKSTPNSIVTASGTATFQLVASNTSVTVGQDVLVVDCLPAGLTMDATQPALPSGVTRTDVTNADLPTGSKCASGRTPIGYTFASLTKGSPVTISLVADVDPNAGGGATYPNSAAIVTSSLADGARSSSTEGVQSATSNTVTETVAGASLMKTASVNGGAASTSVSGRAGDPTTFTLTAKLPKNVNFYGATISDTLPTGMTIANGAGITCTPNDATITCTPGNTASQNQTGNNVVFMNLGDVAAAATDRTVTVTIPVIVPLDTTAGGTYQNTGHVNWSSKSGGAAPTTPANVGNQGAPGTATVTGQRPDVSLTKVVDNPNPKPNDTFTYTLQVSNSNAANTSAAYDLTVSDCVPVGVVVTDPGTATTGAATTSPACGSTLTWTIASLGTGVTTSLQYTAKLAASSTIDTTALVNTASVSNYASLPSGGQTYSSTAKNATVKPSFPQVATTKTGQSGPAYVGTPYSWTVTFTNSGSAGSNIDATDVLPQNWTYDADSATVTRGGTTTSAGNPTITTTGGTQTLEWATLGAAPAGTTVLTYTATPTAAAATTPGIGSTVNHTNSVSATVSDATGATASKAGSYSPDHPTATAHLNAADLTIAKTGVTTKPTAGVAGPQDAWTIVVSNKAGSDQAVGPFTVTDTPGTLPAGAVISNASGIGWSCALPQDGTSAFTCTTGSGTVLNAGQSLNAITVQVTLPSDVPAGTSMSNAAAVTSRTADPDTSNNTATGTETTLASADLAITKTGPATAQAGQSVTWKLAVTNQGPSDAAGTVSVQDQVPAGVTVTSVDGGTDWSCGTPSNAIDCTRTSGLAVGATVSAITVTGTVASGATGSIANTATVSSPTTDPTPANNSSTATSTVDTATTLSVTKTLRGTFTPGADATYRITVENTGSADATGVVVRDPLPTGLTYGSFASVTGTFTKDQAATDPTFDLNGSLLPTHTAVIDLTVHVDPDLRTTVVNTAYAKAANATEQSGAWTNSSTPLTDLAATKSHTVASVVAGDTLDWTIGVTNKGPSTIDSGDVSTVTDTLPAGVTYVGSSGDQGGHAVGTAGGWSTTGPDADGTITWTSTNGVAVGAAFPSITLRVTVGHDFTGSQVANTATAMSDHASQSVSTNTDVVPVTHAADVTITKSLDSSPVTAGTDAHFTITVTNHGPSDARTVRVADLVPTGMTLTAIGATDSGWDCQVAAADCTTADLAPGTATFAVTAHVDSAVTTTLTNEATVDWTDDSSHSASDDVDVPNRTAAGVSVTKSAVNADGTPTTSVASGDVQRWEMVVHGDGPSDAVGPITVTDVLPDGLTFIGLATDTTIPGANVGWTCTETDGTVTCTSDDTVVAGHDASSPLVIATTVAAAEPAGTLANSASVTSGTPSSGGSTNATGTVTVAPMSNVKIGLSHTGTGVIGQVVPFTAIVSNDGPSDADAVTATITLPKGLTFQDTNGTDPSWTAGTPTVHADGTTTIVFTLAGPLAPQTSAPPIVVSAVIEPGAYSSASVSAVVGTSTQETTAADNTSDDAVAVAPLTQIGVTKTHTMALERNHTVAYTITVSNTGETPDPGPVVVTDALPTGLSFVSVDDHGAATCATGSTISCTLSEPLDVGASVSVVLTVRVAGNAPDRIVNEAVATTSSAQVTPPANGATGVEATDPGAVHADPDAPTGALAFTGSTGALWALLAALLALAAGIVIRFAPRRPRRRRGI